MLLLRSRAPGNPNHNMEDYPFTMMAGGCVQVQDGAETILIGADIDIPKLGDRPYTI